MSLVRVPLAALLLSLSGGCVAATADPSVCAEAEAVLASCPGAPADVSLGECTPEAAADAAQIVEGGCQVAGKADIFSQLCIGPLRSRLFWCEPEDTSCEADDRYLDEDLCNGSAELCERRYDEVVYATSHNAFSVATLGFLRPNQSRRMYRQLEDGMRALMIDSRSDGDGIALCHLTCALGRQDIVEGLTEVRDFLECHPQEVVTLIVEPHAPGSLHVAAFEEAGLDELAYTHIPGTPWPTLREMIESNRRLVVFAEEPGDDTPDWYHYQWDMAFDTEYAVDDPNEFECDVKRGESSHALFGLNHFVTRIGGDEFLSIEPNRRSNILDHVDRCADTFGRLPNFLAVDFHDIGDVVETVDELNRRPRSEP